MDQNALVFHLLDRWRGASVSRCAALIDIWWAHATKEALWVVFGRDATNFTESHQVILRRAITDNHSLPTIARLQLVVHA